MPTVCQLCKNVELCVALGKDTTSLCGQFVAIDRARKRPTFEESRLQQECKKLFNRLYPDLASLFFAVPNGAHVTSANRKKLSAEGLTPGVSDMLLTYPSADGRYHCLGIEFKRITSKVKSDSLKVSHTKQSPEQKAWEEKFSGAGNKYALIWSVDDFLAVIKEYLETKK